MSTLRLTVSLVLAALFAVGPGLAATGSWNGVAFTHWNGVAVTAWNGTGISTAGGGGGPDVSEDFEGTGTPSGWSHVAGSSPAANFDQSTAGLSLAGSECLYIGGNSGTTGAYVSFTDSDSCYVYFIMRFEDNPSAFRRVFAVKNNTSTLLDGGTSTDSGGQFGFDDVEEWFTVTADTTYHVWVEYTKGTGSNAIKRIYAATTGTKPGSPFAEVTNGTETSQANRFYLETWASGGGNVYYDTFKLSRTTPLGNNGT